MTRREIAVSTVGPCPLCQSERLVRTILDAEGMSLSMFYLIDCGKCPTLKVEVLPPGDAPASPEVLRAAPNPCA